MQLLNLEAKGRLIGCPVAGWNCHDQKRLDLLGIDFQADELGTEAAIAEAVAAMKEKNLSCYIYGSLTGSLVLMTWLV